MENIKYEIKWKSKILTINDRLIRLIKKYINGLILIKI